MSAPRAVCIHGHFYQPPRENPWTEEIDPQPSAAPYHDWNERIAVECYAPNTAARILDAHGKIRTLRDNYASIAFDFGPTLLSWMARHDPATYRAVIEADRASRVRFGRGSAIAQAYGHAILPLCDDRDLVTQIRWGIADFRYRFGRAPEGMWLPETAVDTRTLEALVDHDIAFTVLSPTQCRAVRAPGGRFRDVRGRPFDTRMPYRVELPSGRSIAVFFYDGEAARGVAFDGLLDDGQGLVESLLAACRVPGDGARLVTVATDGETYGHHHRFGEMALAYALDRLERGGEVEITNHASFLARTPPTHDARVAERTAWSCAHGLGRWSTDCGCRVDPGRPDQSWRDPLRATLDAVREGIRPAWERRAGELLRDPWAARDDYIDVVLDRRAAEAFLARHRRRDLTAEDRRAALELLEIQRAAMLMYTSCGWFFDDISGVEPVQILRYADRAVGLAREALGVDLEPELLRGLATARGNDPACPDGRRVFERHVAPVRVPPGRAATHFAVAATLDTAPEPDLAYDIAPRRIERARSENASLAVAIVDVRDTRTGRRVLWTSAAVDTAPDDLRTGAVLGASGAVVETLLEAFRAGGADAAAEVVARALPEYGATLATLAPRERRAVARSRLRESASRTERALADLYAECEPTLRRFEEIGVAAPEALLSVGRTVATARLRAAFERDDPDPDEIGRLVVEAGAHGVAPDGPLLRYAVHRALVRLADSVRDAGAPGTRFARAAAVIGAARQLPFALDLHRLRLAAWDALRAPGADGAVAGFARALDFADDAAGPG